ncbi:transcriptional adapter 3-like [Tropilaelaps mercedesae]|uniref:Transcriptional adapter 3-like n=1 Tax=Tropilaelaps mercedesae TaxID=418985 RepID=A0A1V9XRI8_9ACAR|nr:transcriptional adapter 3-like [Tropilaelaps mercedesae]
MKGRHGSKPYSFGVSSENTSDSLEDESCSLPEFPTINVHDQCPKYAAIVDGRLGKLTVEEADSLQLELETLLVAVVHRKQQLREQLEALDYNDSVAIRDRTRLERDKGERHRTSSPMQGGSQSKRARPSSADHKSAKKVVTENISRDSSGSASPKVIKGPKVPSGQGQSGLPPPPSNDAPHRFWAYLDDYCKPISDEQIRALEVMLEAQEAIKLSDYVKIPPLGTHYTVKWAQDDLLEEQKEAATDATTVRLIENIETVLHQTAKESLSDNRFGTLTQRLMSCLIEENVIEQTEEEIPVVVAQGRSTSATNVVSIEQRIRRELEELGVMQALAEKVADQDDEVFLELHKCQSQLVSISAHNVRMLRALLEAARRRQSVQALEGRLRAIDNEILEHFRRRKGTARSSRTSTLALPPPTKQDREQLRTLLNERKSIVAQLDT